MVLDYMHEGCKALLRSNKYIGNRFRDASFVNKKRGIDIEISFKDGWGDDKKISFYALRKAKLSGVSSLVEYAHKIKVDLEFRHVIYFNPTAKIADILKLISVEIKKTISGSKAERVAYDFFMELSEKNQIFGKPVRSTQEVDVHYGIDLFVPVIKRDSSGYIFVPIDIKTNPKDQENTKRKNRRKGKKISTLCFSRRSNLDKGKNAIIRHVKRHGRRQKPFNLNFIEFTR
jgi:hypothetical protein